MTRADGNRLMDTVKLRSLQVSQLGLGCMGMSERYGPTDWDGAIDTISRSLELGMNFLDTADIYGLGHNEVLVGRAIAGRRDQFVLATKFGNDRMGRGVGHGRGDWDYVMRSCDGSLLRLGVDYIDLYYLHRTDDRVPIEETVGAMSELVVAGKVREIALSNVTAAELERACIVYPIAAVQNQYSLWVRGVEQLAPVLAQHQIALIPYAPLGRGLLTGEWVVDELAADDLRLKSVPTDVEARRRTDATANRVLELAAEHEVKPAQVALAWVLAQSGKLGVPVIPIPGTKRVRHLEDNVAALALKLDADELASLTLDEDT